MQMVQPTLNLDVLHNIMLYACRDAVAKMMQTCHILNHEGVKYLMGRDICLCSSRDVVSFTEFLVAGLRYTNGVPEAVHRLSNLIILTLAFRERNHPAIEASTESWEDPGPPTEFFFRVLGPLAVNLTQLSIYEAEDLFAAHPPLADTIANLTSLKILKLSFVGEQCAKMLRSLRSQLIDVDLNACNADEVEIDEDDVNPIRLLENSQATLKRLSITYTASSASGPCYPNVRVLSLSYISEPITWHYVRAYPNTTSLLTSMCGDEGWNDDVEPCRERNIALQKARGSWSSLQYFSGTVYELYILGLTCHVTKLELDHELGELYPDLLSAVLKDTHPVHLDLAVPKVSHLPEQALVNVMHQAEVLSLETLTLRIRYAGEDNWADVQPFLVSHRPLLPSDVSSIPRILG